MIRKLLATTALATLIASGAYAQTSTTTTTDPAASANQPATTDQSAPAATDQAAPASTDQAAPAATEMAPSITADGHLASKIIGTRVFNGTGDDAENVGEVNDIVLGADGNVQAVVIGVGGFLGIGEKDVAVDYEKVTWTEREGDRWLVIQNTKEDLEAQTAFDRSAYNPVQNTAQTDGGANTTGGGTMASGQTDATGGAATSNLNDTSGNNNTMAPASDVAADNSATTAAPAAGATADGGATTTMAPAGSAETGTTAANSETSGATSTDQTQTGAIDRSTLQPVDAGTLRAEDFVGTTVYGANDEQVGEIGDVALSQDGKIDAVIVEVGGFLGVGEKEVAVAFDNLKFMQDANGNRYLYTSMSKEQLEGQQAYDKGSYATNRDAQRLSVQ